MARLHPPPAATTAADLHPVAGRLASPWRRQVLLVLAGDALHPQLAAAVRAAPGQRHGDHPVDPLGHRPAPTPPIRPARLAARPAGLPTGASLENGAACRLAARRSSWTSPVSSATRARSRWFSPASRSTSTRSTALSCANRAAPPAHRSPWPSRNPTTIGRERYNTTSAITHPLTQYGASIRSGSGGVGLDVSEHAAAVPGREGPDEP
jgi:hypothetical protein